MSYSGRDIVTSALLEAGVYAQGETPSANDAAFVLQKLNDLFDEWSAIRPFAYNQVFTSYTLTPNLSPHTIGPSGTFVVAQRPVKIQSAQLILNNVSPAVYVPINIQDDDWYALQALPGLTSDIPTDLYYSPDETNGSLYFWPVPSRAYGVRLETWVLLSQLADLDTVIVLAPGYRNAITLTLAENICGPFQLQPNAILVRNALAARRAIMANNTPPPRMASDCPDMPNTSIQSDYNWRTGRII